jgi:hypothetical protein
VLNETNCKNSWFLECYAVLTYIVSVDWLIVKIKSVPHIVMAVKPKLETPQHSGRLECSTAPLSEIYVRRVEMCFLWGGNSASGAFANSWKATMSFDMSVRLSFRMEQLGCQWTESIYVWAIFENLSKKFKFFKIMTRKAGTLHKDLYTFVIISRSLLLKMRNVSDKFVEEINTHILCSLIFLENFTVYEIV